MTFTPGLVTVTFRQLAPREVIELARQTNLTALEWGGDVHVPPTDLKRALEVGRMTREAGLSVVAYGSYFRVGEESPRDFKPILDTAVALGAPAIRVWAGRRGSEDAEPEYRARVLRDLLELADDAARAGVVICLEYHADTLTDTDTSAQELLQAAEEKDLRTLWQPPHEMTVAQRCQSLRGVLPWLNHVHVFHWPRRGERAALEEGSGDWAKYLQVLREEGKTCPLLLEFVRGDDPDQLRRDAGTLERLISGA
jgi:sugar phosphate isomerase/epimerase